MIARYLTLCAGMLFSAIMMNAQNLEILHYDTVVTGNSLYSVDLAAHMTLKNNSSSTMSLKVMRVDKNGYNSLTDTNAICVGSLCYPTTTSITILPFDVVAGATNSDFSGHVYPRGDGATISGDIEYIVFNTLSPFDSASFVVTYSVSPTMGLNETEKAMISAYPNPAKDFFQVELGSNIQDGRVLVYDIVGNLTKVVTIEQGQSSVRVNTEDLNSGVYLYVVEQNGLAIVSKRISIVK